MNRRRFLQVSSAFLGSTLFGYPGSAPGEADSFLDDLARRGFRFFEEQSNPRTGLVRGACRAEGPPLTAARQQNGSVAVTGFGLAAWCLAADRGWVDRRRARDHVARTLAFFDEEVPNVRGWHYHWLNLATGRRDGPIGSGPGVGGSEISSVDEAFFIAGAIAAREYFRGDVEIARRVQSLYERIDFPWMLEPSRLVLRHGWMPESGFFPEAWDKYSEASLLYLLAIASPTHPIPPQAWYAWKRNVTTYGPYRFVGDQPLFTYQYSHAFVDFRGRRDQDGRGVNWFQNSQTATRAHRQFCLDLRPEFPDYAGNLWGITTSDSMHGYVSWGGPPREPGIDGTIVPCAAGGSLMFTPDICIPDLMHMRARFGDRIYDRYGFVDAFNPLKNWVSDVIQGLDVGITLLACENLRTGNLWRWFMRAPEIQRALRLARFAS